jgi:hypothetical protein
MGHMGIYNRQTSGYKWGKGVKVNRWQTQIQPPGFPNMEVSGDILENIYNLK